MFTEIGICIIQLLLPIFTKKNSAVSTFVEKQILKSHKDGIYLQALKKSQLLLKNRDAFETLIKKSISFLGLFTSIIPLQTAMDSKQPSLLLRNLAAYPNMIYGIFRPNTFHYFLGTIIGLLFTIGKRNDIDNSNHPEFRRDWDLRRLTRFLPGHDHDLPQHAHKDLSFKDELRSFFGFIKEDIRQTFSMSAWKTLKKQYKTKEGWTSPQSYQNALSAQIQAAGILIRTFNFMANIPQISILAGLVQIVAMSLNRTSFTTRAWQNRTELDGQLVLVSSPLQVISSIFSPQYLPNLFFLRGISPIAGVLSSKGFQLNSKRFHALADEIQWLHDLAASDPKLRAGDILKHFRTNPEELKALQKQVGKSRTAYLFTLLKKAERLEKKGVKLTQVLAPSTLAADPKSPSKMASN